MIPCARAILVICLRKARVEPESRGQVRRRRHSCLALLIVVDIRLPPIRCSATSYVAVSGGQIVAKLNICVQPSHKHRQTRLFFPPLVCIFFLTYRRKKRVVFALRNWTRPHGSDCHRWRKGGMFQITVSQQETYHGGGCGWGVASCCPGDDKAWDQLIQPHIRHILAELTSSGGVVMTTPTQTKILSSRTSIETCTKLRLHKRITNKTRNEQHVLLIEVC